MASTRQEADEKLLRGTIKFYLDMCGEFSKVIYERHGEAGLETRMNVVRKFGSWQGKALKARVGPSASLKEMAETQIATANKIGMKMEVTASEPEVEIRCDKCPFNLDNTSVELCDAFMDFDRAMWQEIDPKLKMTIEKTTAVGDPQCIVITRR